MTSSDSAPAFLPARPNHPWVAMIVTGGALVVIGFFWSIIGRNAMSKYQSGDLLSLVSDSAGYTQALSDYVSGLSVTGLGVSLLVIAWTIAAVRYRTESVRIR